MSYAKLVVIASMLFAITGCSMFQPEKQTLKVNCNVPDTILKVDGDQYSCPGEVQVRRDKRIIIEAYKDGYDKYTKLIDYHLSASAKWDAVGTVVWFFPVFGFLSPGAWDLDQTEVSVVLNKTDK